MLGAISASTALTSLLISSYYTPGVPSFTLNSPAASTVSNLVRSAMTMISSSWCPLPLPTKTFYFSQGIAGF